jgi:hypothetical protein
MGKGVPGRNARNKEVFQSLAEDLRTETLAEVILDRLKALDVALDDKVMASSGPLAFIRAGGLPTLIRLLKGASTSDGTQDAESTLDAVSGHAGVLLKRILQDIVKKGELKFPGELLPPLIEALGDAPSLVARLAAAQVLMLLAHTKPAQRRAMAEAGVMGAVLAFFASVGDPACGEEKAGPTWTLARIVVSQESAAVRDLRLVICGPQTESAFLAIVILQVCRLVLLPPPGFLSLCACVSPQLSRPQP